MMIYGRFFRAARRLVRLLSLPYQLVQREPAPQGAVYLCQHKDLRGPILSLLWLPQEFYIWALAIYHDFQTSRRHFAEFTLPVRCHLPRPIAWLLAWPVAGVMTLLCRSAHSIPVYRDKNAFKTMGASIKVLQAGHDIMLYPDIDYANKEGGTELYDGFIYLERFYRHATLRHLNFIPVYINEDERQIIIGKAIRFEDGDFMAQKETVLQQISRALSGDL